MLSSFGVKVQNDNEEQGLYGLKQPPNHSKLDALLRVPRQ